jgi:DNA-binding IclR family transcriptional regulator
VLNQEGRPIAAMSISCPSSRLPLDKMPFFGEKVASAARNVTQRLAS